jgi:hypothetical protein
LCSDATIEELKHQKSNALSVVDKYTCTIFLISIVATGLSVSIVLQLIQTFMQLVMKLASSQLKEEIVALAKSDESKFGIIKDSIECIEKFLSIHLEILHSKYTPLLSQILHNAELSGPQQSETTNVGQLSGKWPQQLESA